MLKFKDRIFYGWVVVTTLFVVGTTLFGIRASFGVFFKSIEGEFNLSRTATSAVPALFMLLGCVFAILGGWALDKYGPRIIVFLMGLFTGLSLVLTGQANSLWQLFIAYSLLSAIGIGAAYILIAATVSRWFDRKRGLALGIAGSGAGLGIVAIAPFATYLITDLGWRMAYLVMGLVVWLIVIPLSWLLRRDPREIGALPGGAKSGSRNGDLPKPEVEEESRLADLSLPKALRTRSFWFIGFVQLLFSSSVFLVLTHIVPHAIDIGISAGEAAAVLSLLGGAATAGRVVGGIASDRIGRKLTAVVCTLLQILTMIWLIRAQDLWMLYLFALVNGLAYGGMAPAMGALIGDTFGLSKIGAIFGTIEVAFGVGAAVGPAAGGLIFDITGNYSLAFLLGAVTLLVSIFLIALVRRERKVGSADA